MAAAPAVPPETIGDRIRRARKAKGFSQHELAEMSGISRQSIGNWESGLADPRVESFPPLADVLNVPPEWLAWGRTTLSGWMCSTAGSHLAAVPISPGQMTLPFPSADGITHLTAVPDR